MRFLTRIHMNSLVAFLTILLCLMQTNACVTGNIGEPPPDQRVTFQLPEEWKRLNEVEVNNHRMSWDAVIPTLGQEDDLEGTASAGFEMLELDGAKSTYRPGATPKEKAQIFYNEGKEACLRYNCTVEPIREWTYGGITAYTVTHIDNDMSASTYTTGTTAFFEKGGKMFEMNVSGGKFEAEIPQKTFKKVFETIKLEPM